jgi:hypothetical protein
VTERRDRQPDRVDRVDLARVDRVDLAQVDRVDRVDRVAGQLDLAVCVQVLRLDLVRNQRLPIVVVLALVAGLVEVVVGTQDLGLVVAADLAALIEAVVADLAVDRVDREDRVDRVDREDRAVEVEAVVAEAVVEMQLVPSVSKVASRANLERAKKSGAKSLTICKPQNWAASLFPVEMVPRLCVCLEVPR